MLDTQLLDRKDRPAYVKFVRVAVEDKAASAKEGRYVARDVDYAHVTPPYSKDVFKIKVEQWLRNIEQDEQNGRIPREWVDEYRKQYDAFKRGEEIPLNGTAIRGWGVISPAQQETLIRMNVLTVEDLAAMNDEGVKRVGMGGMDMKNKAVAWLAQLKDKGPLVIQMSELQKENSVLKGSVESLTRQVEELLRQSRQTQGYPAEPQESAEISASDIIDNDDLTEQYRAKFGTPPHHRMKRETIERALKE